MTTQKHNELLTLEGRVVECLSNGQFRVSISYEGKTYVTRCYLNGKMRQFKIKVILGDIVKIELPSSIHLDNSIGRIIYRNK